MDYALFAAKLYDDSKRIKVYSNQLLSLVKKEFITKKINPYDYSRFVNLLTCLDLVTDDTLKQIDNFMERETIKKLNSIDLKI